ncbi:TetR/AcrR family transcriptional regulator C-terminal domain-containing protein [Natronosporangium hydrolyticum]|uniref:TetR/AcrR family transcriptional regulator C-terminal domain-containing protein n=1 Tax=Natronosporangium hydrolyticum TaxID=2811111 RepID=A0A895YNU6_9ACTN|nr:TetR/AcrR family transcriptional regulator [Natronosporangium hydrolyticum]QSB16386.1 TetR/AcrR family transcriptional regulator C-terminal domain-containing protein [Natronosporangium hydrolyticum]
MTSQDTEPRELLRVLEQTNELLWAGGERATRGPKPGLSLDQIVAASIDLADTEGIDALSMRRVAAALGVGAMTLYRYVPNKAVLLNLMLDRVYDPTEEAKLIEGKDWRGMLEAIARNGFQQYLAHRWLLQVNWSRPVLGPNSLAGMELLVTGLTDTPLTDREKIMVITLLDGYCSGLARHQVQYIAAAAETGISDEDFWQTQLPTLERAMATGAYPVMATLAEDSFDASWESTFELGLRAILDGLEQLVRSRR